MNNRTNFKSTQPLEANYYCELFGKHGTLGIFDDHVWFSEKEDRLEANVFVCKGKRVSCYGTSKGFKPRFAVLDSNFLFLFKSSSTKELCSPKDTIFFPRVHSIIWTQSQLLEILTSHFLYRVMFRDSTHWHDTIHKIKTRERTPVHSIPFSSIEALSVVGMRLHVEVTGSQPLVFRFDSTDEAQRSFQYLKKHCYSSFNGHYCLPLISKESMKKGSVITAFEQRFGYADTVIGVWKCRLSEGGNLTMYSCVVFVTRYAIMCASNWGTTKIVIPFSFVHSIQLMKSFQGKHLKIITNSRGLVMLWSSEVDTLYQCVVSCWRQGILNVPTEVSYPRLRVKMLIIGTRGDIQPIIPFALKLHEAGHYVTIATHDLHRDFVERATRGSVMFGSLPGDPRELMELCVGSQKLMSLQFIRESASKFRGFVDELFSACWDVCKQETDVIITNPPTLGGPVHVAEKLNIPLLCVSPFPWTRTEDFPHPFAVPKLEWGTLYNCVTHVLVEHGMWLPIRSQSNKFRKTLGLPDLNGRHSLLYERKIPIMYCWSAIFVPKPIDWPSHVEVTGYWFQEQPSDWQPSQQLLDFLSQAPTPIYIGFGSVTVENPDKLTQIISEALNRTRQRAVILQGWGGLTNFSQDNVFVIDFAPHEWLFPRMQGIIHHGGAGTCAASLQAGVPSLVVPFFGDQFFWGHQMLKCGAGISPIQVQHLTTERLSRAIMELISNPSLKIKAQAISKHIREEDGVNKAMDFFHYHVCT